MKLKYELAPQTRKKLEDAYFVGKLASMDDIEGINHYQDSVFWKDEYRDDVQFLIKCLSPIPEELSSQFAYTNKIMTGSTRSSVNVRKLDEMIRFNSTPDIEKVSSIRDLFKDKLIVFTLKPIATNVYVELHKVEDIIPSEKGYSIIPGPEIAIHEAKQDIERKLVETGRAIKLPKYPDFFESPELIYVDNTLYRTTLTNGPSATSYVQKSHTPVTSLDMAGHFIEMVDTRVDKYLYFIDYNKLLQIRDDMEDRGINLNNEVEKRIVAKKEEDKVEDQVQETEAVDLEKQMEPSKEEELHFIHRLKTNAKKRERYYEEIDLFSFHISAKTNLITVIGGMSGTGKSQLAQIYGDTLGLTREKQRFLMIPISPSYREPNDILGYLNPTTGIYHESETGLISMLLEAEENPNQIYMCVFDEMNLARVEHYFSPFISLLEADKNKRYLSLFSDNSHCVNKPYKPKIKIGDNIIFVGTVNFDETTNNFSDRLLDRTNVITPTKISFKEARKIATSKPESGSTVGEKEIDTQLYRSEWGSGSTSDGLTKLEEHEVDVLDDFHLMIQQQDTQKGVSFRVAESVGTFLSKIPHRKDGELMIERKIAFDLQLKQRVLTKIQGLESFVGPLVGTEEEEGSLMKYLKERDEQEEYSFKHSIKLLESKRKELIDNGFVI